MSKLINLMKIERGTLPNPENHAFTLPTNELVCASLANIRKVAQHQNMMLCPIEYFDLEGATNDNMFSTVTNLGVPAYFDDKEKTITSINNFISFFSKYFNIYVLTPLSFYNMAKHFNSKMHNLEVYAPSHQLLFDNLPGYFSQLQQISVDADKNFKERELQRIALDPMLFAVAKSVSIYDDKDAILGTCWGADITPDVINNLEIYTNPNIRDDIIDIFYNMKENHLVTIAKLRLEIEALRKTISEIPIKLIESIDKSISTSLGSKLPGYAEYLNTRLIRGWHL